MSKNVKDYNTISFFNKFDPKNDIKLENFKNKKGRNYMIWKCKNGKKILFNSPLMRVLPKKESKNGYSDSFSVRINVADTGNPKFKNKISEYNNLFKNLNLELQNKIKDFLREPENGKNFLNKELSDDDLDSLKIYPLTYPNGMYFKYTRNTDAYIMDNITKTIKLLDKDKYIKDVLVPGSIFICNFTIESYVYKGNVYIKPEIKKITFTEIMKSGEYKEKSGYGFLKNYALPIPDGYSLHENIIMNVDVPVNDVKDFRIEKYSVGNPTTYNNKKRIFTNYDNGKGAPYFKADDLHVGYNVTAGSHNVRAVGLSTSFNNSRVINLVSEQFGKVLKKINDNRTEIFGDLDDEDEDLIEADLVKHPLYSKQNITVKRLSIKFPISKDGDCNFKIFLMNCETKKIEELKLSDPSELEKYIKAGSILESLIFSTGVHISSDDPKVFFTRRVEQILINPKKDTIFYTSLNGFSYPGYDNVKIENRADAPMIDISVDNLRIGKKLLKSTGANANEYVPIYFEDENGKKYNYCILPKIKLRYEMALENKIIEKENEDGTITKIEVYPFKVRYLFEDNKELETICEGIDDKIKEYCKKNVESLLDKKKFKVDRHLNTLIRVSKKGEKYGVMKVPVYDNKDSNCELKYKIDCQAFKLDISPDNEEKILSEIKFDTLERLLDVFYKDVIIKPIVQLRLAKVNDKLHITSKIFQVLIEKEDADIPIIEMTDDALEMMSGLVNDYSNDTEENGTPASVLEEVFLPPSNENETPALIPEEEKLPPPSVDEESANEEEEESDDYE